MMIYNFITYTIYCSSVLLLAVSLIYLIGQRKNIDKLDFFGLFIPTVIILGYLLLELQDLYKIKHIILESIFIFSYSYINYKLAVNFTRDIYNTALRIDNMFNSPNKHIVKAFQESKEITFKELLDVPENLPIMINKNIVIMRLPYPFEHVQFRTWIKEGGSFEAHVHPDCIEFVSVVKGKLKCKIQESITSEGEILIIPPNVKHHPYADEYTELMVYFKQ